MLTMKLGPDPTRCNTEKVVAHARQMTDCSPVLKVKLEGPINWKEWNYEYSRKLFTWDISYRHYIYKKLTLNGAVSSDVKSYYQGKTKEQLKRLASAIDTALRTLVLNNINNDNLHFHETPDGNHTYEDLRTQVKKACTRDPLMSKVGELRSFYKSLSSTEQATRHFVVYGFTDWKLQVLAGIEELKSADDHLMRRVIKALDESDLDEEYKSIVSENNYDVVSRRIDHAIDEVIVLAKKTNGDDNLHENEEIMSIVGNNLLERVQKSTTPNSNSSETDQSSNTEQVTCSVRWTTTMNYHTVMDASLLWDAQEANVSLCLGDISTRALIGSLRVQFPSGLKARLNNAAYLPYIDPIFSSVAARDDEVYLLMSPGELFLQNTGEKLCDVTEGKGFCFDLKFERQTSSKTALAVTSTKPTPNPHNVGFHNADEYEYEFGVYQRSPLSEQMKQRSLLNFHRKFGHPGADQFHLLQNHLDIEDSFSRNQCLGCMIAEPTTDFPDDLAGFTIAESPIETTHISIQEMIEPAYDGSRFLLTLVDELTKYATGFLLKNKGEAVSRIDSYLSTNADLFRPFTIQICDDDDSELAPSIETFCDFYQINLVSPRSYASGDTKSIAHLWGEVIVERARCSLSDADAPEIFWPAAVSLAVNQINSCPMKLLDGDIPLERWQSYADTKIELPKLAVFGSIVHYNTPGMRKTLGCYLGPNADNTCHLVLSHDSAKIVEVEDFEEDTRFFFGKCHLEVYGSTLNAQDTDALKSVLKIRNFEGLTGSAKELEHQRSLLEGVFEFEHWQGQDSEGVLTPASDDY